jgi:cytidylate kinase
MTESSYLEKSLNEFKQLTMLMFEKLEKRMNEWDKNMDERFNEQNKKLQTVMDTNLEHSFVLKHAGKLFWLIAASAVSVLMASLVQLFRLV